MRCLVAFRQVVKRAGGARIRVGFTLTFQTDVSLRAGHGLGGVDLAVEACRAGAAGRLTCLVVVRARCAEDGCVRTHRAIRARRALVAVRLAHGRGYGRARATVEAGVTVQGVSAVGHVALRAVLAAGTIRAVRKRLLAPACSVRAQAIVSMRNLHTGLYITHVTCYSIFAKRIT